jgi:protein-tyrosine phosphatase
MNHCSYFIKDKAMFGSFPTQESVEELENEGVIYFVDLTSSDETKITPYTTNHTYIKYPILDRNVPENIPSFCRMVIILSEIIVKLRKNEKLYLHCRAGHGRSGILVASILCYIFKLSPYDSLLYTTKCHSNRSIMKDKWRRIGSPQTYQQKKFIYKLFHPINMNKIYKPNIYSYRIYIKDNIFNNIFHAYNYYSQIYETDPSNVMFVEFEGENWDTKKENIMKFIVVKSIESNYELRENLLNSHLRPIIAHLEHDSLWGIGHDNCGQNKLGKMLDDLRLTFIRETLK